MEYFRELGRSEQKNQILLYFNNRKSLQYMKWAFQGAACLKGSVHMANWICRETPLKLYINTDVSGEEFMKDCFFMAAENKHISILQWMTHTELVDRFNLDVAYRAFHAKKPFILYSCLLAGQNRIYIPWSESPSSLNTESHLMLMNVLLDLVDQLPFGLSDLQQYLPTTDIASYFLYKQYRTCVQEIHRLLDIFINIDPINDEEKNDQEMITQTIEKDCPLDHFTEVVTNKRLKDMEFLRDQLHGYIIDLSEHEI